MSSVSVSCCQPPASSIGCAPPDSGRAVEVEEDAAAGAPRVLEHEVAVEQNGFYLREKRIVAVDVRPARLHHANLWIGEVVDGAQQKIFRRSEVGVKDGDELTLRRLQPLGQRSCLEAFAIGAVMVADGISQRRVAFDQVARDFDGFVGGIVEHLDVELLPRIFQLADRLQQPLDHILLIEDGQLHGDARQLLEVGRRVGGAVFLVLVIQINQNIAVHAVAGEQDQHNEIRNQQRAIECVRVVKALKSLIQQMLAEIGPNALGGSPCGQRRKTG